MLIVPLGQVWNARVERLTKQTMNPRLGFVRRAVESSEFELDFASVRQVDGIERTKDPAFKDGANSHWKSLKLNAAILHKSFVPRLHDLLNFS
jgi:hypothetical protein